MAAEACNSSTGELHRDTLCPRKNQQATERQGEKLGSIVVDDSRPLLEILEQAKIETTKKFSACLGLRGRENQVEHRSQGSLTIPYGPVMNVPVVVPQSSGHASPPL